MMVDLYVVDHGEVHVSEREAALLELARDIRRNGDGDDPAFSRILAKADAVHVACERFAEYSKARA